VIWGPWQGPLRTSAIESAEGAYQLLMRIGELHYCAGVDILANCCNLVALLY